MKCLCFLLFCSLVFAKGEDTALFLKLPQSVRSLSMGNAYVGIGEGIDALNYNPAGLGNLKKKEGLLGYTRHFADIPFSYIAYGQPLLDGVGAIRLFLMNTHGGDEANIINRTGKKVNVKCRLIALSYARKLAQEINIGGSIKLTNQDYSGYKGDGFCYDIGVLGKFYPMSFGFSLNNLGRNIKIDNVSNTLPFTIKLGLGYKIKNTLFTCDIEKPKASPLILHLGTEYNLLPNIDLRGGYDSISGYSLGFGIREYGTGMMKNLLAQIDYAYLYNLSLNSSHRISVLTRF